MELVEPRSIAHATTISATPEQAGARAAAVAADAILSAIASRGSARVIFASAPSQAHMLAALGADDRIDWSCVSSFHMDEYVGLPAAHPQSFGQWLQDRLPEAASAGLARIRSTEDGDEPQRYAALLAQRPIDLTCLGFGVNGHIAFNEPDVARFDDSELVRRVRIDEVSRIQQVDDGQFGALADVPEHALTMTVPALVGAGVLVATVIGERKARAVRDALSGPVSVACPASVLRRHPAASVHLDRAAASLLPPADVQS